MDWELGPKLKALPSELGKSLIPICIQYKSWTRVSPWICLLLLRGYACRASRRENGTFSVTAFHGSVRICGWENYGVTLKTEWHSECSSLTRLRSLDGLENWNNFLSFSHRAVVSKRKYQCFWPIPDSWRLEKPCRLCLAPALQADERIACLCRQKAKPLLDQTAWLLPIRSDQQRSMSSL